MRIYIHNIFSREQNLNRFNFTLVLAFNTRYTRKGTFRKTRHDDKSFSSIFLRRFPAVLWSFPLSFSESREQRELGISISHLARVPRHLDSPECVAIASVLPANRFISRRTGIVVVVVVSNNNHPSFLLSRRISPSPLPAELLSYIYRAW